MLIYPYSIKTVTWQTRSQTWNNWQLLFYQTKLKNKYVHIFQRKKYNLNLHFKTFA